MTRRAVAAFLFAALAASPAAAQTTLDFEDFTGYGPMPYFYGGIQWADDWGYYDEEQYPYTAHSGDVRLLANNVGATDSPYETFWNFLSPATGISAWFAGQPTEPTNPNQVSFNFYYLGSLVHSTGAVALSDIPIFLDGSGYAGAVDQVSVYGSRGYYIMDDLSFTSTAVVETVPEPATMTLLATGLAGMAAARRRKRTKV